LNAPGGPPLPASKPDSGDSRPNCEFDATCVRQRERLCKRIAPLSTDVDRPRGRRSCQGNPAPQRPALAL